MALPKLKAVGQRGSWFAHVDGESIPCVHDHWTQRIGGRMIYVDPYCFSEEAKWVPFLAALREEKRAILTKDKPPSPDMVFERMGYIALFRIDHLTVEGETLRFQFLERLADLA